MNWWEIQNIIDFYRIEFGQWQQNTVIVILKVSLKKIEIPLKEKWQKNHFTTFVTILNGAYDIFPLLCQKCFLIIFLKLNVRISM